MNNAFNRDLALHYLQIGSGHPLATFRNGQEEAIRHVVEGRGRLLVVQSTGWGKSFVYFIATRLLREHGHGPTILFSPLLALMRNQIAAATRMGVKAASINSENSTEWHGIEEQLCRNEIDLLIVSPERLSNERFRKRVLTNIRKRIGLLVVDEAHCISDWGHDFRPHYRLIERMIPHLPVNLRLLATTATANDRVMDDLRNVLGPELTVARGNLNRPSLTLQSIRLPSQAERLAWLAEHLATLSGHGIIYTLTKQDCQLVAHWLQKKGYNVEAYSSETGDERHRLEQALLNNQVKALVATIALGMGFDKSDLSFVIHYQMPGSVVAYYQQVGRAGRALDKAYGILLSAEEEEDIIHHFIRTAFPGKEAVMEVLQALEKAPEGLTLTELLDRVNIKKSDIEKIIELLVLEPTSPSITLENRKWQRTPSPLSPAFFERAERMNRLRFKELYEMQEYVKLPFGRHMNYLLRALDSPPTPMTAPLLPPLTPTVRPDLQREADIFLKSMGLVWEPRRSWPPGGMPNYNLHGPIPNALQAEPGQALCTWGDGGWGNRVKTGKYRHHRYGDDLVTACASMIHRWNPSPAPTWVTVIPSLRHPELVPDFARRLALTLNLPFHPVLTQF
ncbi:MAG: ATP-dependent DNA helicase RecQ, partial [Magnetococcales bacterium]|nr:ATP-dependent DNA helicase RecQ [Magnetococcales bacterium]